MFEFIIEVIIVVVIDVIIEVIFFIFFGDLLRCVSSLVSPQDPVLFVGTVRQNLDPFHQHGDDVLWQALSEVSYCRPATFWVDVCIF